jgi:hypothetical protein
MLMKLFRIDTLQNPPTFIIAKKADAAVEIYVSAAIDRDLNIPDFTVERWDEKLARPERLNLQALLSSGEAGLVTCDALDGGWSLSRPD